MGLETERVIEDGVELPGVEATEAEQEEETGELEVTLGEDTPAKEGESSGEDKEQKREAYWIRNLRKMNKKQEAELRELRQKLESTGVVSPEDNLPKEPELEDYDYDSGKFKQAWKDWNNKAEAAKAKANAAKSQQTEQEQSWQARLAEHKDGGAKLGVADYEDAEAVVTATLSPTQLGILISTSDNSNLLTYALGRNPAKLENLAGITDPAKFIREMTKLEMQMKTTRRAPTTKPESRPQRGSVGQPPGSAVQLEKLRAEADKTGDRSKVIAYMRQQRAKT